MRGFVAAALFVAVPVTAAERVVTIDPDRLHVAVWNRFADDVYKLHEKGLVGRAVRETVTTGEYGGSMAGGMYYREVAYSDARTGRLLSRVRSDRDHAEIRHIVEAYVYDEAGRVVRDYVVIFLPWAHKAPIRTLITLHRYPGTLHAMRQFDASGERIYEQCSGAADGTRVDISLDWGRITPQTTMSPTYGMCFDGMQEMAGDFLTPQ